MDGRPTWTDCDEAGDYVVPNVLSPRDLVFRPDNMDETVQHNDASDKIWLQLAHWSQRYSSLKMFTDGQTDGRRLDWYTTSSP